MHGRANLNLSLAFFTRAIARKELSRVCPLSSLPALGQR